jgi:hypothetical protein
MLEALKRAGPAGLSRRQLAVAMGCESSAGTSVLTYYRSIGLLVVSGRHSSQRYYLPGLMPASVVAAKPVVKREGRRQAGVPQPAVAQDKRTITPAHHTVGALRRDIEAVVPADVKRTVRLMPAVDDRYQVDPSTFQGGALMAEWRAARGGRR